VTRRASSKGFVHASVTTPIALLGTLAASLTAAPAHAQAPASLASLPAAGSSLNVAALMATKTVSAPKVLTGTTVPATHTVKGGDTVWAIAQKYGLSVSAVLKANNIGSNALIFPGQKLVLPGKTTTAPASTSTPKPATTTTTANKTHKVVRGDTVWAIAQKYGSTVSAILTANKIGKNALIFVGQKLIVPVTTKTTSGSTSGSTDTSNAPSDTSAGDSGSSGNSSGSSGSTGGSSASTGGSSSGTSTSTITHKVVRGDTVWAIAQKYGSTVSAILNANSLNSNAIIYVGQTLKVPGATSGQGSSAGGSTASTPVAPNQKTASLDAEQIANVRLIIAVGRDLGVSDRGIAIALATAMVESWIRNLNWGDRDSLGLFQQRPSAGWGTAAQIMNAERSIRVFFGGPNDPNGNKTRGLLDIPGWQSMGFSKAAQSVQISAYPDRYGQWEVAAYKWIELYG
jgi:LysM repeat protein